MHEVIPSTISVAKTVTRLEFRISVITSPRLELAVGLVSVLYGTMLLLLHTATIYEYGVGGDEWGEIEGTAKDR